MEPQVYSPQGHNHFEAVDVETPTLPYGSDYKLKMVTLNGEEIAAFNVDGEDLLCFPQVYEYFLKDLVSGMHTVYTKLKRMNIQGRNCNVEQVRMMRSVGAIGQVVNRCKLISREDFNRLYEDCLLFRGPGRRKKNPDIPPELLNNPFKHFKVDHHPERLVSLTPNGESTRTDETNNSISHESSPTSVANVTFDGPRDVNNNANGGERKDSHFKTPFSRQSERLQNITLPQAAMNHSSPHVHVSPRYTTTHVIHSPTNAPSSRMVSPPSGVILAPNSQPCTFSFPPRPHMSMSPHTSALSPQTNGAPPVSGTSTAVTHSPGRSPAVGDAVNGEASVPHVSSTGTSEHAEFRIAATNDTGSEMSVSSPHVLSREPEYREPGSTESLLLNIQGLLKVAAENTRQHERQAVYEKNELRRHINREREARERAERQSATLQRGKAFLQKKLKKEKKAKRKLGEQLIEEQHRCELLEEQLRESTQDALKQRNEELLQELDRERCARIEAERKLKEARGEIQNFVNNFLENPTQEGSGHQSEDEQEELNVDIVKEEQILQSS